LKQNQDIVKILPFYLIVSGFFLIRISPDLLSHGLFMDGLIYSTLAKNLSDGIGTFWNPYFTATCLPEFHEHPPLAMAIQSIFFSVLGDGRLTEKIYSFLTYVIVSLIIMRAWQRSEFKNGWLPLFLWFVTPVVSWACPNNLLENTLTIFTTLSLLFFLESRRGKKYLFLFLSGSMLSLGFLTKGFVALFPWSLPFVFWLAMRKSAFKNMISETLMIIFSTIVPLALLLLIPEAGLSLKKYIDTQVIESLKNVVTVSSRFYIAGRLASELIPALIIVLIFLIYGYRSKDRIKTGSENFRYGIALIVTGLTGVLPIMISQKQSGFYILPSLPFFAIGLAALINDQSGHLISKIKDGTKSNRNLILASCLFFMAGLFAVFYNMDKFSRDESKLKDTYAILPSVPAGTIINILPEMYGDWSLHGYYARFKNISLDPDLTNMRNFLLIKNEQLTDTARIRNYKKADIPTSGYQLYIRE
jgi:4-amino-4-deoxy-L-arabinose transferase-like glycosyltransferase